jgi:hypothetical protein
MVNSNANILFPPHHLSHSLKRSSDANKIECVSTMQTRHAACGAFAASQTVVICADQIRASLSLECIARWIKCVQKNNPARWGRLVLFADRAAIARHLLRFSNAPRMYIVIGAHSCVHFTRRRHAHSTIANCETLELKSVSRKKKINRRFVAAFRWAIYEVVYAACWLGERKADAPAGPSAQMTMMHFRCNLFCCFYFATVKNLISKQNWIKPQPWYFRDI